MKNLINKNKMVKNNKGFMLVEVIVITVIVISIMTGLYMAFIKIYDAYEQKNMYTSVDAIYALSSIEDTLVDSFLLNNLLRDTSNYNKIECNTTFTSSENINLCKSVFEQYSVKNMYLVNKTSILLLRNVTTLNPTFVDYLNYLINTGVSNSSGQGVLVVELEENGINNYGYLPVG